MQQLNLLLTAAPQMTTATRTGEMLSVFPRHNEMGRPGAVDTAVAALAALGFRGAELLAFADRPVKHNGCHEWGDVRTRHLAGANRTFARRCAEALQRSSVCTNHLGASS